MFILQTCIYTSFQKLDLPVWMQYLCANSFLPDVQIKYLMLQLDCWIWAWKNPNDADNLSLPHECNISKYAPCISLLVSNRMIVIVWNIWVMFIQKGLIDHFESKHLKRASENSGSCVHSEHYHNMCISSMDQRAAAHGCAPWSILSAWTFYVVSVFPPVLPPLVKKVEVLVCLPCSKPSGFQAFRLFFI